MGVRTAPSLRAGTGHRPWFSLGLLWILRETPTGRRPTVPTSCTCSFSMVSQSQAPPVKPVLVNEVGGLRDRVLAAFVGGETPRNATVWRWSSTRGWPRQRLPSLPRRGLRTTGVFARFGWSSTNTGAITRIGARGDRASGNAEPPQVFRQTGRRSTTLSALVSQVMSLVFPSLSGTVVNLPKAANSGGHLLC